MPAPVVQARDLSKSYGRTLFEGATFQIEAGERVAIVGPNGAGKSTLLRLLAGRERPDHGSIEATPRIHWFDQHPDVPPGATVRDLMSVKDAPPALVKEKEELEARVADPALYESPGYEAVLERYAAIDREIQLARQGADAGSRILQELGGLDLDQDAASLSGGEKTRAFLARTLEQVRSGDLVVLDEPTNHLDVDSIEWLEEWAMAHQGTLLVVAHDRVFLDNIATRILEVSQGAVRSFPGDYEDYVVARDEDVERRRRAHEKAKERVAGVKDTIMQFRHQKRFDGQYASRMKSLDKYKAALEHTPDPVLENLGFGLDFGQAQKSSNEMLRATGLTKSFGSPVLAGLDLEIVKGDRIGLVGGNGAGKSTLLSILTGRAKPDAGTIRAAPGVRGSFFSQEHDDLRPDRTMLDEVLDARPTLEERDVKALIGRFRFVPENDLRRTVKSLSGGERQRLKLLKCVLKPSNLLILDEPTNHLDLAARDVVVSALNSYHGTLVLVSHDRYLLDATTETTAILENGVLHTYPGTFTETRDQHRKRSTKTDRYVVRRRFADWGAGRKYAPGEELEIPASTMAGSMTLRNALAQGWLEPR